MEAAEDPVFLVPTQGPHWENMTESLRRDIYRSDQLIYPAPDLTYDRYQQWAAACPDLFMCLRRGQEDDGVPLKLSSNTVHGVIITLPLRREYWEKLVAGEIEEHDIDAAVMFPSDGEQKVEVGLHVFHIERCPEFTTIWSKGTRFTEQALQQVSAAVADDTAGRGSWRVVGYSALTASPQGRAAFRRAGFRRVADGRLPLRRRAALRLHRLAFRCRVLARLALRCVGLGRAGADPERGAPAEMMECRRRARGDPFMWLAWGESG